jgi:hypothetical protein
MSTKEQDKDKARLRSYIEREQLSGVLNDTKWQLLFESLRAIEGKLDFLRRDVRDSDISEPRWDSDIYHVFGCWENIEWLCIRAKLSFPQGALLPPKIENFTNELIDAVKKIGIPYSKTEDGIKVWGYLRPGVGPEWES